MASRGLPRSGSQRSPDPVRGKSAEPTGVSDPSHDEGTQETDREELFISVVLPVRNEARFIEETLTELMGQNYPVDKCEFLVCDGMSSDPTRDIVQTLSQRDDRVQLLDNTDRLSSAGRNVGFRHARGELVVVIDGHVHLGRRDYLAMLSEHARRSGSDCLGRPQPLLPTPNKPFSEALAWVRSSWLGHSPSSFIHSNYEGFAPAASMGAAYRPHVFDRIGYVDESFDACEDLEFNTRLDAAGLTCWTSPDLAVSYYARESLSGLFRQMYRYGYGRTKYMFKHPRTIGPLQLAPAATTLAFFAWLALAPFSQTIFDAGFLLFTLYFLVVLIESVRMAMRTSWRHLGRYFVILTTIHFALGMGTLVSIARRGKIK